MLESIKNKLAFLLGYQTVVSSDTIYQTTDNYELDDKIAPRFHNEGETDVYILNIIVKPGEMFNCSATTIPMRGTINIIMPDEGESKIVCVYNSLIKKECP